MNQTDFNGRRSRIDELRLRAHLARTLLLGCLMATMFALAGCRTQPSPNSASQAILTNDKEMVRTELYFGLSKHDGSEIDERQFDAFVEEVVTPRFPDGLTIVDAYGQWRGANGKISGEKSKLLIILHKPGAESAAAIEAIRAQYKSRFGQESVMRVTSTAGVSF